MAKQGSGERPTPVVSPAPVPVVAPAEAPKPVKKEVRVKRKPTHPIQPQSVPADTAIPDSPTSAPQPENPTTYPVPKPQTHKYKRPVPENSVESSGDDKRVVIVREANIGESHHTPTKPQFK